MDKVNIDRKSHDKSPQKIQLNKKKEKDINDKSINYLNKSASTENIYPSDMENDDEKIATIKNFNDLIKKNNNKARLHKNSSEKISNEKNCENIVEIQKTTEKEFLKNYKCYSLAGKDLSGKRKINQDVYLAKININNIEGFNAFGVLDGHGEYGHEISRFTRDFIIEEISKYLHKKNIKTLSEIYSILKKDDYSLIKEVYQKVDKQFHKQKFNANFSGTTCVIVFQIGHHLITANVGDSRAILVYTDSIEDKNLKNTKIIELSIDQKPELPHEKERIYKKGGIVDQMLDGKGKKGGPFRVWAGRQNFPGLAMSRSIGDLKGKQYGLISEPEIIEYKLNEKSKYMVICSDGVWEFLKNEDVMNIGNDFYVNNNIDDYIKEIIRISEYWWKKEDIIRDDITAVVVFF